MARSKLLQRMFSKYAHFKQEYFSNLKFVQLLLDALNDALVTCGHRFSPLTELHKQRIAFLFEMGAHGVSKDCRRRT